MSPELLNKLLLWGFVTTWATVIPTLAACLWWFVKKDRSSFFAKLRQHEERLDMNEKEVADLNTAVFGLDGASGINKWEHRARGLLQPVTSEVAELKGAVDKLRLAIARAVPGVSLSDLSP